MDSASHTARQRDAAARRRLGLGANSHVVRKVGAKSRRWTEQEIRTAVLSLTGGRKISHAAYRLRRRDLDPNLYPSHNTVAARCPDLFD